MAAGVMPRMTVVMVGTTRRKTCFPTGVTTSATKAKPPAVATAFCVLSLPYLILGIVVFAVGPADLSAAVTPSANRNTYSVTILFCIGTQGRGASPLNPGLGKRNSYRVAAADGWPLPGPPQGAGVSTCCVLGCLMWLLPLGEGWDGTSMLAAKIPLPSFPFCGNRRGACRCFLSPLGE